MKAFTKIVSSTIYEPYIEIELDMDTRRQSKIISFAKDGTQLVISVERGIVLKDGMILENSDGIYLLIRAAKEPLSQVTADNELKLVQLAYHLGNRHTPLEIRSSSLLYQTDHVLDAMVEGLGGKVQHVTECFIPEEGAYSHSHSHSHPNDFE